MSDEPLDLEQEIVAKIIHEVHSGRLRISDSGQRELHFTVRGRLQKEAGGEIDKAAVDSLITEYAEKLRGEAPPRPARGRAVVRRLLVSKVVAFFKDTWPLGS